MSKYSLLIARLNQELANIDRTVQKVIQQIQKAQTTQDNDFYDAATLNLQKFYMGAERIFIDIARDVDAYLPSGSDWHKLLQQMVLENGDVRPAVLSSETYRILDTDYRGFRHVAAHLYAFELKPEIQDLAKQLPDCYRNLQKDIQIFCQYLQVLAQV